MKNFFEHIISYYLPRVSYFARLCVLTITLCYFFSEQANAQSNGCTITRDGSSRLNQSLALARVAQQIVSKSLSSNSGATLSRANMFTTKTKQSYHRIIAAQKYMKLKSRSTIKAIKAAPLLLDKASITPLNRTSKLMTDAIINLELLQRSCQIDECPQDESKLTPGTCGCGMPDIDSDGDGLLDCHDICPNSTSGTVTNSCGCQSDNTELAPPTFDYKNNNVVFVDIAKVNSELSINVDSQRILGKATVFFAAPTAGVPVIDLAPSPSAVNINGSTLSLESYERIADPTDVTKLRVLDFKVEENSCNKLTVEYEIDKESLSEGMINFGSNGAELLTDMFDGHGRSFFTFFVPEYWEQFAPSNLEFDRYKQELTLRLISSSATLAEHEVFSNGSVSKSQDEIPTWLISYPEYFSTSSFFLHLYQKDNYKTITREHNGIPITLYAKKESTVDFENAYSITTEAFDEMERDYGAYVHGKFLAYLINNNTPKGASGIEYPGATVTKLTSLRHEIFHSWFARGVFPADGSSGWIDEALAVWFTRNYTGSFPIDHNTAPTKLVQDSPYNRGGNLIVFSFGSSVMSALEKTLTQTGNNFRGILSELYLDFVKKPISTDIFQKYLEQKSGQDLGFFFDKFIYGEDIPLQWHNPSSQFDVNADGRTTPIDALLIIGELNTNGGGYLCTKKQTRQDFFIDVNNDCFLTPIDALQVIGELNRQNEE